MKSTEMPTPDAVIEYPNGHTGLAMFHYGMPEDTDAGVVARENGFDSKFVTMEDDNEELYKQYTDDRADHDALLTAWKPEVPEGWTLAETYDTEDGPVAMFVRKHQQ